MTEHLSTLEHNRLSADDRDQWRSWGPYLAERAWGTVREDYSASGDAWNHLPHDAARSVAYRWNEDGMGGVCDVEQRLCLAVTLWNGKDPIVKERLFGLANEEGNHGEDVKERYWYEDGTPSGSLLKWRYHYPQAEFPYSELVEENRSRGRDVPEYEIGDTGVFDHGYWDVALEVAKASPTDLCWELVVTNRGPLRETLDVMPTLWFRNDWSWSDAPKPSIRLEDGRLVAQHATLGTYALHWEGDAEALLCDNETNSARLYGLGGPKYPKDGINDHVVSGANSVNPEGVGTKAALRFKVTLEAGESRRIRLRLVEGMSDVDLGEGFTSVQADREVEADAFFHAVHPDVKDADRLIVRQALAGLVWSQCYYAYDVAKWTKGDIVPPPLGHAAVRNSAWAHFRAQEVILMPDTWEYPWFAAWDLAFHAVGYAHLDPRMAKDQLLLLLKDRYMAPTGALPAYEWEFSDSNPPLHAWAALEVFHIDGDQDLDFLGRMFHRLLINFSWWVNKQDSSGNSLFEGGFLGMDNVGPFDRSHPAPTGGVLEQSDGTAWMANYCLDMMQIALHLSVRDRSYEDIAMKFLEHFVRIASAMTSEMWDERDGFFYDVLNLPSGARLPMRVRSVAGLVSLAATRMVSLETLEGAPEFRSRVERLLASPAAAQNLAERADGAILLSVVPLDRLETLLESVFDEDEFLSPYGIRSLSRTHLEEPYWAVVGPVTLGPVTYEAGESQTGLFGGNSNWRGPIWLPINHVLVTAIRRLSQFVGDDVEVMVPSKSGNVMSLGEAGDVLADRLVDLVRVNDQGRIPAAGLDEWPEGLLLFPEYFNGDTGEGLGASHQTGWTALLADLVIRRNVG